MTEKERPIIFNAEMVRAILEGRKSQTRRYINPQPKGKQGCLERWAESVATACGASPTSKEIESKAKRMRGKVFPFVNEATTRQYSPTCPYGKVGDVLYVRETWVTGKNLDDSTPSGMADKCLDASYRRPWAPLKYPADGATDNADCIDDFGGWGKKRPSIHMPKWASRIKLVVKDVRVERVRDISHVDACAEGIELINDDAWRDYSDPNYTCIEPWDSFRTLWDSINGKKEGRDWASNPYVWCVEFERQTNG